MQDYGSIANLFIFLLLLLLTCHLYCSCEAFNTSGGVEACSTAWRKAKLHRYPLRCGKTLT
jgi:hypothetical protein